MPCQVAFAVKSNFCSYLATTNPVRLPVTRKHIARIFFMSPIGRTLTGAQLFSEHYKIHPQNAETLKIHPQNTIE